MKLTPELKEIAMKAWYSKHTLMPSDGMDVQVAFLERFLAALPKSDPVAWYDCNKFYANEESASMGCADMDNLKPVYIHPPIPQDHREYLNTMKSYYEQVFADGGKRIADLKEQLAELQNKNAVS